MPWAEMAQNSLRHSSTNFSPFQCVLGYQPVLAPWHQSQNEAPAVDDWFWRFRMSPLSWLSVSVFPDVSTKLSVSIFQDVPN